jgi:HPt (histidine-containing phosphotransfer) domain-containing protein
VSKTGQEPGILDHNGLWDRVGYDRDLLRELLRLFREQRACRMSEIRAAIQAGDAKALSAAAHALKGAIGNFSVLGAFSTAERLQQIPNDGMQEAALLCDHLESELLALESHLEALVQETNARSPATVVARSL